MSNITEMWLLAAHFIDVVAENMMIRHFLGTVVLQRHDICFYVLFNTLDNNLRRNKAFFRDLGKSVANLKGMLK